MKYFFVTLELQDGEHEHIYKAVAKGADLETVRGRVQRQQTYEYDETPHENSICSFGDGETGVGLGGIEEINGDQFITLKRFLSEV